MLVSILVAKFILLLYPKFSLQDCPEEISQNGISVTWPKSRSKTNIESDPLCYHNNDVLITRDCINSTWYPDLNNLRPCMKVFKYFDLESCPPGFSKISENNTEYCYQIGPSTTWDYPCFKSGGATVLTDLDKIDIDSLISSLQQRNDSRFFWLPAKRLKYFNPIVWTIPGPNWSRLVMSNKNLPIVQSIMRNCLLLDIDRRMIMTEACDRAFPSLCFYVNNQDYPSTCPKGYYSFRFMPDKGTCFGIEYTDNEFGSTFNDFLTKKCEQPMGDKHSSLTRFVFKNMAELIGLPDNEWCWFESSYIHNGSHFNPRENGGSSSDIVTEVMVASFEGIVNNEGTLGLMNTMAPLNCMACEASVIYNETELLFEYNTEEEIMYLTVYFPTGLWKYDPTDHGVQCFSNAKGFIGVIGIEEITTFNDNEDKPDNSELNVEKIVYKINLVTTRSAQYWCEAHTKNFTLLQTKKIVANPQGNDVHVFSLVIKTDEINEDADDFPDFMNVVSNITEIFNAEKAIVMDILNFTDICATLLLHLHITIELSNESESFILPKTYNNLLNIAETQLSLHNIIFVNISSSTHCFPTTSQDVITLDWELTPIGQMTAPKQFCLQSNGLPVKRQCGGSYSLGSVWGPIDGNCSRNYEASDTTTFLYNVAKGQTSFNYTTSFLTDGLNYVLSDTDIIIPADIYYLSMSFQYVLSIAQENTSLIDIGDIKNIAWAMNRVMVLDNQYLRLSQTLNSTNVIVDSVNDIIEIIAQNDKSLKPDERLYYQIAAEPNFVVQISYPFHTNVSGIALLKNSPSGNLSDMTVVPLYTNTTIDYIMSLENIEIATWVPEHVLNSLKQNLSDIEKYQRSVAMVDENLHVVISVFFNDAVFQEIDWRYRIMNSRIVGVSIPGYVPNLVRPIPLIFRPFNISEDQKFCSYWDFHSDGYVDSPGFWSNDGCYYVTLKNNLTMCKCYHLTHFGQLISIDWNRDNNIDGKHSKALNVITLVGCFLSLLGIVGIWVTAVVFHSWRQKPGTKVLLQLTVAIALPLILMLVFNLDNTIFVEYEGSFIVAENMTGVCIALGALLHYSILSGFVWMLITAILQFIRYVRVLGVRRPSRFMIKFALIGWGIPLLPVGVILIVNCESYLPLPTTNDAHHGPICYPTGLYFIYAVVLPIIAILVINIALFVSVMYSISRGPDGKMRSVDLDLIGAQLRLSIFLFFLLGLSWFFGILTFSNNVTWSYLFCLTSTLQGFVLFLYFVICDPTTRNLWVTLMKPQFISRSSSSRESIVSINN